MIIGQVEHRDFCSQNFRTELVFKIGIGGDENIFTSAAFQRNIGIWLSVALRTISLLMCNDGESSGAQNAR